METPLKRLLDADWSILRLDRDCEDKLYVASIVQCDDAGFEIWETHKMATAMESPEAALKIVAAKAFDEVIEDVIQA